MGVSNECIPYQEPGERLPCSVLKGKTVVGCRFVKVADDMQGAPDGLSATTEGNNYQIEPAGAGDTPLGVASHNAAAEKKVTVLASPGMVVPVKAEAAIEAGDLIEVGEDGEAAVAKVADVKVKTKKAEEDAEVTEVFPNAVGLALADAAEGDNVPVKLF